MVIDMTGRRIGLLKVVGMADKKLKCGQAYWHCICDCGGKSVVIGYSLRHGLTNSCGCLRTINMVGQTFGRLVVLQRSKRKTNNNGSALWDCQCVCGSVSSIEGRSLRRGMTRSCGCLRAEITAKMSEKHWRRKRAEERAAT